MSPWLPAWRPRTVVLQDPAERSQVPTVSSPSTIVTFPVAPAGETATVAAIGSP